MAQWPSIIGMMEGPQAQFEDCVIIIGVGLIGGSIAAAVRKRFPECRVVGVGRSQERLQAAEAAGLLTESTTELTPDLFAASGIAVVCLPVDMIAESVSCIADVSGPDVVITDAGSVKGAICDAVVGNPTASRFVGSHPIAGGENGGFEFADADLFEGSVCVVTPTDSGAESSRQVQRTRQFWEAIGCRIVNMSPHEHDAALALTSHLPHVMAAATATAVGVDNLALAGTGFRDVTRVAAGDARLWEAILTGNRDSVVAAIQAAEIVLAGFREALVQGDQSRVEALLEHAANCRNTLDKPPQ